ncbi:hypothetical protein P7K49_023160 [Saguinus oedipus]|uniref:Uncharacterized protein n=1 Tax=Saguinus oedipus TaxID=9490 RepID=A0ABQ9UKX9_SAGOE|nr:hypothetical protein P7K49_023160 [Saguinus oedipus]
MFAYEHGMGSQGAGPLLSAVPDSAALYVACALRDRNPGPEAAAQCILGRRSHGVSCPFHLCPPSACGLRAAAPGLHAGRCPAFQHRSVLRGDPDEARAFATGLGARAGRASRPRQLQAGVTRGAAGSLPAPLPNCV